MSRYIDADALIEEFAWCKVQSAECNRNEWDEIITRVSKQPTVDAIKRLTDEIDRKDKAIQAFLKQIEQMIAERKKLRDTLIESICVNCDTPPDVRLRVCGECPIISPIREVFDE